MRQSSRNALGLHFGRGAVQPAAMAMRNQKRPTHFNTYSIGSRRS